MDPLDLPTRPDRSLKPAAWNCGHDQIGQEVNAQAYPCERSSTTIPLHSLSILPFTETVRRGKQFLGGNGYLSGDMYRRYLKSGRILVRHVDDALVAQARLRSPTSDPAALLIAKSCRACPGRPLPSD